MLKSLALLDLVLFLTNGINYSLTIMIEMFISYLNLQI